MARVNNISNETLPNEMTSPSFKYFSAAGDGSKIFPTAACIHLQLQAILTLIDEIVVLI